MWITPVFLLFSRAMEQATSPARGIQDVAAVMGRLTGKRRRVPWRRTLDGHLSHSIPEGRPR